MIVVELTNADLVLATHIAEQVYSSMQEGEVDPAIALGVASMLIASFAKLHDVSAADLTSFVLTIAERFERLPYRKESP